MADMGQTETTATGVDVVSAYVQEELTLKSRLLGTIMDFSYLAVVPGAKSVKIPRSGSFSIESDDIDKVENTASTTQAITYATDDLDFNKFKHVPVRLEDEAKQESAIALEEDILKKMASAIVRAVEADIHSVIIKAANDIQLSGTSNLLITKDNILEAIEILDEAFLKKIDFLLFHLLKNELCLTSLTLLRLMKLEITTLSKMVNLVKFLDLK